MEVDTPGEEVKPEAPSKRGRNRALRFVSLFVVLVMGFLTSYRYAMNTEANMWYLFQVAKHTTWLLGVVGESSELQRERKAANAFQQRTDLAQLRGKGSVADSGDSILASAKPLTAWESWLYLAHTNLSRGGTLQEDGPSVHLVLREGIVARRTALRKELEQAKVDEALTQEAREAETKRIDAELMELQEEEAAIPLGPIRDHARRDIQFTFRVVPDCGAIPSISIYLAAVLAFPALLRQRVLGAFAGVAVLYVVNVARLATLGIIGALDTESGGKYFNFIHEYVWQGIFIIFVVVTWMAWIELVVKVRRT